MSRMDFIRRMRRQMGVSMVEMLGSIAIGSVVMSGVANQTNSYIDNVKDAQTAEQMRTYAQAAHAYVQEKKITPGWQNWPDLKVTNFTAQDLKPYLPAGFTAGPTNPYGQTPCLVVRKEKRAIPGSTGTVDDYKGFLVFEGGNQIPEGRRAFVATMAGLGGGYVDAANKPKGPGWSEAGYGTAFGKGCAAPVGAAVVSLNLFNSADVQDCRYLSIEKRPNCGDVLNRDLNLGGNVITNVSGISTTNNFFVSSRNININPRGLQVSGTIVAQTLRATKTVIENALCPQADLGTLARKGFDKEDPDGNGALLTCRRVAVADGPDQFRWKPLFVASEEKLAIAGCWEGNNFCADKPEDVCDARRNPKTGKCDFDADNTKRDYAKNGRGDPKRDGLGNMMWEWETEIGKRMFCSLGFHAQTLPSDSGVLDPEKYAKFGKPDHTFCRVYPVDGKWFIKVGSAYKTPIACHAVCVDDK